MGKTNIYNDKYTGVFVRCIKFHLPLFIRCLSIIERSGFNFVGDKGINKKKNIEPIGSSCKNEIFVRS